MPDVPVLVVEDDAGLRELLVRMLAQSGWRADMAGDGAVALKMVEARAYRLVITDIVMPNKEGIETLLAIKARRPDTKILAISGGGRIGPDGVLGLALKLGADAALRKPVGLQTLITTVRGLLAGPADADAA